MLVTLASDVQKDYEARILTNPLQLLFNHQLLKIFCIV